MLLKERELLQRQRWRSPTFWLAIAGAALFAALSLLLSSLGLNSLAGLREANAVLTSELQRVDPFLIAIQYGEYFKNCYYSFNSYQTVCGRIEVGQNLLLFYLGKILMLVIAAGYTAADVWGNSWTGRVLLIVPFCVAAAILFGINDAQTANHKGKAAGSDKANDTGARLFWLPVVAGLIGWVMRISLLGLTLLFDQVLAFLIWMMAGFGGLLLGFWKAYKTLRKMLTTAEAAEAAVFQPAASPSVSGSDTKTKG